MFLRALPSPATPRGGGAAGPAHFSFDARLPRICELSDRKLSSDKRDDMADRPVSLLECAQLEGRERGSSAGASPDTPFLQGVDFPALVSPPVDSPLDPVPRRESGASRNVKNLSIRTDDHWLELEEGEGSPGSPRSPAPRHRPAISLPGQSQPRSAPPCPRQMTDVIVINGNGYSSSNGGTPTILKSDESLLRPHELEMNSRSDSTTHDGPSRLQQSLSTPCPEETLAQQQTRRDGEYRRFKSEGSAAGMPAGSEIDGAGASHDDLSPIADPRSSPPHRALFQQDSVVQGPLTKHSHTEQVMMMHTLKTKISKYQTFIDEAFKQIAESSDQDQIIEGCTIVLKIMTKSWMFPKISHDLSYALCDYIRDQNYLETLIQFFIKPSTSDHVRATSGRVLEEILSLNNREYIVNKGYLKKIVATAEKLSKNAEQQRISLSIMENLFKHSTHTSFRLIEYGVLDHILLTCKRATDTPSTLKHAALALANLSLYSCSEGKKKIIQKKVPDWLFLLASQPDDLTRYYACLAICMLAISKELESAVLKSGTLALVEPFLLSHEPTTFAGDHYKHSQGRPKEWLKLLLPMLATQCECREAKSMAAFHFTMEATIKKEQNKLDVFQEIGAIQALKEVASSPNEVAAKFASEALTIIGEVVPHKLSQQVPNWAIEDVEYWVKKIKFDAYAKAFVEQMVDGDLLLRMTEAELEHDIHMTSSIHRKRFLRELDSLKIAADYSSVDQSRLDQFLGSISPELSIYTYSMLTASITRDMLPALTDDLMQNVVTNNIHRLKLKQAFQDVKHIDDVEVALLSKQIDVFISYRRDTGSQLASLIRVLLKLRGYKVFIDVDKLTAGKFDSSLLKNIQAAKHFILVLTPNSMDRLINDNNNEDWVHKELRCAIDHNKNIIPVLDNGFEYPLEAELPEDIRQITKYNGIRWVHDYQEACIDKIENFLKQQENKSHNVPIQQQNSTGSTASTRSVRRMPGRQPSHRGSSRLEPSLLATAFSASSEKQVRRKPYHSSVSGIAS